MINELEREIQQKKLEEWGKKYPLAAQVMLGNMTHDELVKYAEEMYPCTHLHKDAPEGSKCEDCS